MTEINPKAAAFMATVGTVDDPIKMSHWELRQNLYGAAVALSNAAVAVNAVHEGDIMAFAQVAPELTKASIALAQIIRADLVTSLPGAELLSEEDWIDAAGEFIACRFEQTYDEQGLPRVRNGIGLLVEGSVEEPGVKFTTTDGNDDGLAGVNAK